MKPITVTMDPLRNNDEIIPWAFIKKVTVNSREVIARDFDTKEGWAEVYLNTEGQPFFPTDPNHKLHPERAVTRMHGNVNYYVNEDKAIELTAISRDALNILLESCKRKDPDQYSKYFHHPDAQQSRRVTVRRV